MKKNPILKKHPELFFLCDPTGRKLSTATYLYTHFTGGTGIASAWAQ